MLTSKFHTQGGDIPLIIDQCTSPASTYWLPVLLAYKGLFLIIGLWLAVRTYRVKIKELRDSKLIVACVIGTCVVSIVLTLITLLLPTNRNADYAVIGAFIMPLVTGVLFLLFVTRVSTYFITSKPFPPESMHKNILAEKLTLSSIIIIFKVSS